MKPKPTVRKVGHHWVCAWPAFGFSTAHTTYHPTWRDAVNATAAGSGGAVGGTAERRDGLADGVGSVSPWTPLSYGRGVWTWQIVTRPPTPVVYTVTPTQTRVWWHGGPPPPTPSGGPVPVGR